MSCSCNCVKLKLTEAALGHLVETIMADITPVTHHTRHTLTYSTLTFCTQGAIWMAVAGCGE